MTRHFVAALVAAFSVASVAEAQTATEKRLIALENAWVAALVKADVAKLDAMLSDAYVDTEEGGHRTDKAGTLAVVKSGDLKCKSLKLSNMKVIEYGNSAVVTGDAAQSCTFQGHPIPAKVVFTDTFVRQKGAWKAVASQRTVAPKG